MIYTYMGIPQQLTIIEIIEIYREKRNDAAGLLYDKIIDESGTPLEIQSMIKNINKLNKQIKNIYDIMNDFKILLNSSENKITE